MDQLASLNAFVAVPRQKAVDERKKIVNCTWAFKRKRFPDGTVKKLKARLCLNERGFKASTFDPCLFISNQGIILSYVDDCILFSKSASHIHSVIEQLKSGNLKGRKQGIKYLLEVEGDYAGFLGIDISQHDTIDGALELLQTGLIDRILAALS